VKQQFVFIFRQGARTLTADEQKRRTEEVRAWALRYISNGTGLDPRILGEESHIFGDASLNANTASPVTALNFLEATDFNEAEQIAQTHPGLRYGISIEVRPWRDPRA
jgi:hypothetical protein